MKNILTHILARLRSLILGDLPSRIEKNMLLSAQAHVSWIRQQANVRSLKEIEFSAFSQWGEDGIIQYLIHRVLIENRTFVEFGVENYTESNTRFLLLNDNWHGLVLDASQSHIDFIRRDPIYWKFDLTASCQFVTRENINEVLLGCGLGGDIGLLSIDIDGNDYWVWDEIDCIEPRIVICEYNSLFGPKHAITVPYRADFVRTRAHYSNLYYGASLAALCRLATKKGYGFVGTNSAGSNAFFVRNDLLQNVTTTSAVEGFVQSKVRESRSEQGRLTFLRGDERLRLIEDLPVIDLERDTEVPLRDLFTEL